MLTDLVVASPNEAAAVSASHNRSDGWLCFESTGLDNSVLAALWSSIDPEVDSSSLEGESHLILMECEEGPWVFNLPGPFAAELSRLSMDHVPAVAERWVSHPELAAFEWQAADVVPVIEAIASLARTAEQEKKSLLLWMSL